MQALETIEGYDNIMRSVISFVDADSEIDFCVDLTQTTSILNLSCPAFQIFVFKVTEAISTQPSLYK